MKTLTEEQAFALATPCPYTLITSLDKNGKPNAMGASWITRVSFDPCLIMISIAPGRYSHEGIEHHKEFVVNYPSTEQEGGAWVCGTKSGRDGDKFRDAGLSLIDSTVVKAPTINGATVAFECKVVDEITAGDHTLFIGQVVAMRGNPDRSPHLFITSNYKLVPVDNSGK